MACTRAPSATAASREAGPAEVAGLAEARGAGLAVVAGLPGDDCAHATAPPVPTMTAAPTPTAASFLRMLIVMVMRRAWAPVVKEL